MPTLTPHAAAELRGWFQTIEGLTDESVFGILPGGPHREAIVLDTLKRNARILWQTSLDKSGQLYSPLCFFLAAACRKLGVTLGVGHWQAALENVIELERRSAANRAKSATVGLATTSPAEFFKQEFDEAVRQAGIAGTPSFLDVEDRQIGLGLAVNWTLRLLLAYAVECSPSEPPSTIKDLAWLSFIVRSQNSPNGSPVNHPDFSIGR